MPVSNAPKHNQSELEQLRDFVCTKAFSIQDELRRLRAKSSTQPNQTFDKEE